MTPISFLSWVQRKKYAPDQLLPQADKVLPVVAQAGRRGMTRGEIGSAIDLDRDALDDLLNGLVRFGLLIVSDSGGIQIFRVRHGMAGIWR